jgi:hypothetical protein
MKKPLLALLVVLAGIAYFLHEHGAPSQSRSSPASRSVNTPAADALAHAFAEHRSNVQVMAEGVVVKMLADDSAGSRHQRFLLALPSGQTVLVAHNIDLASRVDALRVGDRVSLAGEYEWNERGGVIHWTHRDPRGTHIAGWIQHQGRTYQ